MTKLFQLSIAQQEKLEQQIINDFPPDSRDDKLEASVWDFSRFGFRVLQFDEPIYYSVRNLDGIELNHLEVNVKFAEVLRERNGEFHLPRFAPQHTKNGQIQSFTTNASRTSTRLLAEALEKNKIPDLPIPKKIEQQNQARQVVFQKMDASRSELEWLEWMEYVNELYKVTHERFSEYLAKRNKLVGSSISGIKHRSERVSSKPRKNAAAPKKQIIPMAERTKDQKIMYQMGLDPLDTAHVAQFNLMKYKNIAGPSANAEKTQYKIETRSTSEKTFSGTDVPKSTNDEKGR